MSVPQAPVDASGGYLSIKYTPGGDTHHMRLHVLPFSTSHYIIGGGTPSVTSDDGNHDYAYQPDRTAGMEAGLSDTFQAFVNVIKPFYHSECQFTLDAVYQNVGNVLTEVFPVPQVAAIAGTNAGAAATGQPRAGYHMFNFRTKNGGKARITLIGLVGDYDVGVPYTVGASSGGSASEQAIVAYLSGSATGIVGHDGQNLNASAHVTQGYFRRLRRRYGYA